MPEIYDPNNGNRFRSRRRRKRNNSSGKGTAENLLTVNDPDTLKGIFLSKAEPFVVSKKHGAPNSSKDNFEFAERKNDADVDKHEEATPPPPLNDRDNNKNMTNSEGCIDSSTCYRYLDPNNFVCSTSTSSRHLHAVAVDTRHLDTEEGKDDQNEFQRGMRGFLYSSFRRGLNPSIMSWTESDNSSESLLSSSSFTNNTIGSSLRIHSKLLTEDDADTIKLNGTPIPPYNVSDSENTNRQSFVHLPKGLMATNTWQVFGDLAKAVIDKVPSTTATNEDSAHNTKSLRIVIFTKETSSFLDPDLVAHQRGADAFLGKIRGDFLNRKVHSIQIVVVTSDETLVVCTNDKNEQPKEKNAEISSVRNRRERCSSKKLFDIIKSINNRMQKQIEENFKANRSRIQFDTRFEDYGRMDVSLLTVDSRVGFYSLYQKWSREMVAAMVTNNGSNSAPKICFQLPETCDFDAVELFFFAFYKSIPFRLDSTHAENLCVDLGLLSRAHLQVLQLIPLSSVDSSLIYGVTISLKAALRDNEDEHQEQLFLVQSFLKNLVSKDCALLIRSKGPAFKGGGLFHSSSSQYFLFVPEFGPVSRNGVLHRIADIDHILDMSREDMNALTLSCHHEAKNIGSHFSEYIEASLDCLDCSPFNPYLQHYNKDSISDLERNDDHVQKFSLNEPTIDENRWTDDSGVGVKGTQFVLEDVEDSDGDQIMKYSATSNTQEPWHRLQKSIDQTEHPKRCNNNIDDRQWEDSDTGESDSTSSSDDTVFGTFDYSP